MILSKTSFFETFNLCYGDYIEVYDWLIQNAVLIVIDFSKCQMTDCSIPNAHCMKGSQLDEYTWSFKPITWRKVRPIFIIKIGIQTHSII